MRDLNYGGLRREPFRQGVETLPHQGRRGTTSYQRGDFIPRGGQPCGKLHQTTVQSIPSGVWTKVTMEVTDFDNEDPVMADLANDRLTIRHAGIYLVVATVGFVASGTGQFFAGIGKNGTPGRSAGFPVGAVLGRGLTVDYMNLIRGDFLECQAWQNSGVNKNTEVTAENQSSIMVVKIAPPV